jgi:hypothetical protein
MPSPSTTLQETNMYADKLDTLGKKLADTALTLLVRLYPEVRQASTTELDAACAAMRAKSRSVIDELIDDAKGCARGGAHRVSDRSPDARPRGHPDTQGRTSNESAKPGRKSLASCSNSA